MGPAKSKYFFGTRAAGTLWDATQNTPSRDLASAIQSLTGGVIFRILTGTRNGSGVMDVNIEDSDDNLNWAVVAAFSQITSATTTTKDPGRRVRRFVRLATTLTSGTSFSATRMWAEYVENRESGCPAGTIRET